MPDYLIAPIKIVVPQMLPERLSQGELDIYRTLAARLMAGEGRVVPDAPSTVYMRLDELHVDPAAIGAHLELAYQRAGQQPSGPSLIVVDMSQNEYQSLRDGLLHQVSRTCVEWLARGHSRTVALLLPRQPPRGSGFELPLLASPDVGQGNRLVTITGDGGTRWWVGDGPADLAGFSTSREPEPAQLRQRIESRLVRKLGHYDFLSREEPHCARYYFDVAHAHREVGDYIVTWASGLLEQEELQRPLTLLSHGNYSEWLEEAVGGAATPLDCFRARIDSDGNLQAEHDIQETTVALVLDVVHTGRTFEEVVENLRAQGITVAHRALVVVVTDRWLDLADLPITPDVISLQDRKKVSQGDCEQCSLGLPYTERRREPLSQLRSYDMWEILSESDWGKEAEGPSRSRFGYLPDLGDVCNRYGDWLAYWVQAVVKRIGGGATVFVCPNETNVGRLVDRLGTLLQNAQMTVPVPRSAFRQRQRRRQGLAGGDPLWKQQLRHLGNSRARVVTIDEFSASGDTTTALHGFLREYGLQPALDVSIVDYTLRPSVETVPRFPLYRIPYPRNPDGLTTHQSFDQEEPATDACAAILYHLLERGPEWDRKWRTDAHESQRAVLLLADYARRSQGLPPGWRARLDRLVTDWFYRAARPTTGDLFGVIKDLKERDSTRSVDQVDVVVVTVIQEELEAVVDAFGCSRDGFTRVKDDAVREERRDYPATVECRGSRQGTGQLSAVITAVGGPNQVPMTDLVARLRARYQPKAIFLVGIAGGQRGVVDLGDVVVPRKVSYCEPGRKTAEGSQYRPDFAKVEEPYLYGMFYYTPSETYLGRMADLMAELSAQESWPADLPAHLRPSVLKDKATIASSEEVVRDEGKLIAELRIGDETVRAVDQESYGFAEAARGCRWLVFRGISDHCDQQPEVWKYLAASSAAHCLRDFLETQYLPPGLPEF